MPQRKTVIRSLLVLVGLVFAWTAPVQAESIRAVTEEWAPYNYSQGGKSVGVVTEVVRATLERTGLPYSIEVYPWARAYDLARGGENILIFSIVRLPNREPHFKWIKLDGLTVDMYLFKPRHRKDIRINSLTQAQEYRIGVTRDSSTHHFLLAHGFMEEINLFPVCSERLNVLKSRPDSQRIDMTSGDRRSTEYEAQLCGLCKDYWQQELFLFSKDLYMAFGWQTSDQMVNKVRDAFRQVRDSGRLAEILEQYTAP